MANTNLILFHSDAGDLRLIAEVVRETLSRHGLKEYTHLTLAPEGIHVAGRGHPGIVGLSIDIRPYQVGEGGVAVEYRGNQFAFWVMLRIMHAVGHRTGGKVRLGDGGVSPADPSRYPTFDAYIEEAVREISDPQDSAAYQSVLRSFVPPAKAPPRSRH
jgi:hypothetical protein